MKRYNKLVRDKIPEICLTNGAKPTIRLAKDKNEYIFYLQKKVIEEAKEIIKEKDRDKIRDEVADLLEVLACLLKTLDVSNKEIYRIRKEKNNKRGAFKKRIILINTKESK